MVGRALLCGDSGVEGSSAVRVIVSTLVRMFGNQRLGAGGSYQSFAGFVPGLEALGRHAEAGIEEDEVVVESHPATQMLGPGAVPALSRRSTLASRGRPVVSSFQVGGQISELGIILEPRRRAHQLDQHGPGLRVGREPVGE